MSDEPSQLDGLIDDFSRALEMLGAAELDVRDRQADEAEAHERTLRAECALKLAADRAEEAERAVHRRIRAMAKSGFEDEIAKRRCRAVLGPIAGI